MDCKARQYSDQMQCAVCGLAWDMNDDDRPPCLGKDELLERIGENSVQRIREMLDEDTRPLQ